MGTKAGFGLKLLQWIIRGVQFLSSALILGVYSYFLATLHNHGLGSSTTVRAVAGISGAATLYTLLALLLLCCVAGLTFTSFLAIILDVAFIGAFIYVAVANRDGAGSCDGYVDTPFGRGNSGDTAEGNRDGFTALPSFRTACRLQTACLAVAIISIIFFILSILMEVALARHHRKEKRFGPSPHNNYTSGAGDRPARGGFFARMFRRKGTAKPTHDDYLPEHAHPNQVDGGRQSYATETTAVNADNRYSGNYKPETGYGYNGTTNANTNANVYGGQTTGTLPAHEPAGNYRYGDGVYDRA
ncbi:membrane-associating domain-containing protein [Paramyrothecium foliicola]|nr:membrane-associating domain-containing protein [Paramyrothecium foliicola]